LIVFVCIVSLSILGIAIAFLHWREKKEDEKKREQHFDFF